MCKRITDIFVAGNRTLHLEYAIMKFLNLIGQFEGCNSLRATVRGLYQARNCVCNNNVVYGYIKKNVDKYTTLLIQNIVATEMDECTIIIRIER